MLFGSNVLEIALGLTFLYLLLAIISSAVNEWIAGIFKLRAKTLREGIANLLGDPQVKGLAAEVLAHPAIKGLTRNDKGGGPSYIPSRAFAEALLDVAMPEEPGAEPQSLLEVYQNVRAKLATFSESDSALAKQMLKLLQDAGVDPQRIQEAAATVRQVEQARQHLLELIQEIDAADVAALKPLTDSLANLQQLETAVRQAEANASAALFQAQKNVELYFDQSMDRVSGWYKRRAQVIVMVIALIATVLLNADTINIARRLAIDPELRTAVINIAEQHALQQLEAGGTGLSSRTQGQPDSASIGASETVSQTHSILIASGLPLGWDQVQDQDGKVDWDQVPKEPEDWLYKTLGLLITAIAVSLGAPFWFEMLNKLVNLRMSGKLPAETADARGDQAGQQSSVLASRVTGRSSLGSRSGGVRVDAVDRLASLAVEAVDYVRQLQNTQALTVPERDVAMAWMMVETTDRAIVASPAEIESAVDDALRRTG